MTDVRQIPRHRLASLGFWAQAALVGGSLSVAWLLAAPLAGGLSGLPGLGAAAIAAGLCFIGGVSSLLLGAVLRDSLEAMHRMVLGMGARALFPLILGVALHARVAELASAGLIFYVLVFYMVSLAAETAILLAQVPQPLAPKKVH